MSFLHAKILSLALKRRFTDFQSECFGPECVFIKKKRLSGHDSLYAKIPYLALKQIFTGFQIDSFGFKCVLMVEKLFVWFIT